MLFESCFIVIFLKFFTGFILFMCANGKVDMNNISSFCPAKIF